MRFHTHGFFLLLLFLLASPAASQAPPPGPDPNNLASFNPSMGVIIIVLIAALFFMGFFSIYIRHCSDDADTSTGARITGIRTGFSRRGPRGLDPAVIESFPTFDYSAVKSLKIGKGALECAICITEFEEDETLRLIPKCDHVFHPDCIDAWLISHTTCPVCRADLVPRAGESLHAPPELHQINEAEAHRVDIDCEEQTGTQNDDVSVDVVTQRPELGESMEQPLNSGLPPPTPTPSKLNRNRTRRNISGRPRWFGKFSRSNSTGHMAVKQWENLDRFTLRLPEDVRKQIISGKLSRTTSCVALPMEESSRSGNRTGFGEGSSRGRRFGSGQLDRAVRSDRWVFSLTPPFFSREPSFKSPRMTAAASVGGSAHSCKAAASVGGSAHSCKAADSVHRKAASEAKLPPV